MNWNGIYHYEPIYGKSYLQRIQDRDKQRYLIYEKNGFKNYIIKDMGGASSEKVESEFKKLLKQISAPKAEGHN